MSLDTQTLFTVATCITGLLGVFLLVVWVQERSVRALAWWGAAYLMGGSAVALWGVQGRVAFLSPEAPNALLFASCGGGVASTLGLDQASLTAPGNGPSSPALGSTYASAPSRSASSTTSRRRSPHPASPSR